MATVTAYLLDAVMCYTKIHLQFVGHKVFQMLEFLLEPHEILVNIWLNIIKPSQSEMFQIGDPSSRRWQREHGFHVCRLELVCGWLSLLNRILCLVKAILDSNTTTRCATSLDRL